ncbi:hypothetical protein PsYK624_082080 [Phanerochaete sordida]|uniref:Fungal-type protein kinase domain-containing protein n=1 Tax=Phanerochaete sordida TaxID=48140 RepID=A0A9P3GE07_9APHY|nr:hypothetical protein PsYK624_082080 [Phanerochaete sordida]
MLPNNISLCISSEQNDKSLQPHIAFRCAPSNPAPPEAKQIIRGPIQFNSAAVDIVCEIESCDNLPFLPCRRKSPESIEMANGAIIRGRLAQLAEKQFKQQHRVSLWQIILNKKHAHLIRWERSGAVVSEAFNPNEDPWIFHLLSAYPQLNRRQKGFDESAHLLTEDTEARQIFSSGVDDYQRECQLMRFKVFSSAITSRDSDSPMYRLDVPDKTATDGVRACLVTEPFYTEHCPLGRATRVYVAYDLVDRKLRILKDGWRPEHPGCLPEHVSCARLAENGIEHVPNVVCGGDVAGDLPQETVTQDLAVGVESTSWRLPCAPKPTWRKLVHFRILEDIALPLENLENSCQLLLVIHDIVKAISLAHTKAKLLHRDITWFNIRWSYNADTKRIEGVLIDWDHAVDIDQAIQTNAPHTSATWQFMSLRLIIDPMKTPELIDDFESLFWSLYYGSLHFVAHDKRVMLFGDGDIFNPGSEPLELGDKFLPKKAATEKRQHLLDGGILKVKWASTHFTNFMHDWSEIWRHYYFYHDAIASGILKDTSELTQLHAKLSDPQRLMDEISKALEKDYDGWREDDMVPDQFPKITARELRGLKTAIQTGNNDAAHMSVDGSLPLMPVSRCVDPQSQVFMDIMTSVKRQYSMLHDSDDELSMYPAPKKTKSCR